MDGGPSVSPEGGKHTTKSNQALGREKTNTHTHTHPGRIKRRVPALLWMNVITSRVKEEEEKTKKLTKKTLTAHHHRAENRQIGSFWGI